MSGGGNGGTAPGDGTGDFGGGGTDAPVSDFGGGGDVLQYGNWAPAFFMPHSRSIGGIVAQVTIDEQASDDIQITEHPVEQGAPIADHAFKRPAQVTIRAGWSRDYARDLSAESGVYGLLLSWQAALLPFDVYTGKRHYTNMLIERLQVTTDNHSEYSLMATIACRQVIIVSTATTDVPMAGSDNDKQDPASQEGEVKSGDKQATETGTVSSDTATYYDPSTGQTVTFDPATGLPSALPSTPQAGAVSSQLKANGAQPPNNPSVPGVGSADIPLLGNVA